MLTKTIKNFLTSVVDSLIQKNTVRGIGKIYGGFFMGMDKEPCSIWKMNSFETTPLYKVNKDLLGGLGYTDEQLDNIKIIEVKKRHPFHIVINDVFPFLTSFFLYLIVRYSVRAMHSGNDEVAQIGIQLSVLFLLFCVYLWWWTVAREGTVLGNHTRAVQRGLRMGMVLFITTEVMFFFSFFWAFFSASLSPAIQIGAQWPPVGIPILYWWEIPLANTLILLTSGLTLTYAHHSLVDNDRFEFLEALLYTVLLGCLFTKLQYNEYKTAAFNISDGVYGSTFYLTTGFHGAHVLIGTVFLVVCLIRGLRGSLTPNNHVGLECAAWYWHFVDVVWILLFLSIYVWGNYQGDLVTIGGIKYSLSNIAFEMEYTNSSSK